MRPQKRQLMLYTIFIYPIKELIILMSNNIGHQSQVVTTYVKTGTETEGNLR